MSDSIFSLLCKPGPSEGVYSKSNSPGELVFNVCGDGGEARGKNKERISDSHRPQRTEELTRWNQQASFPRNQGAEVEHST